MEIVGILLSVSVGLVLSLAYCALLAKLVRRVEPWRRGLRVLGVTVLAALVVELIVLGSIGPQKSARLFGAGFYAAHLVIFVLGAPALANVLVLQKNDSLLGRWYVAAAACTALVLGLVLLQYGVSEALFGID